MPSTALSHRAASISGRFADVAARDPDRVAIVHAGKATTYRQLMSAAIRLALRLSQETIATGEVVGIFANRSPDLIVSMLATAMCGAPFVIFDAAFPDERIRTLIGISRPKRVIFASSELADRVRCERLAGERSLSPPAMGWVGNAPDSEDITAQFCDRYRIGETNIAYFLFTSGTTGTPKCIACSHPPLLHFIDWQLKTFDIDANDRFTALSGIAHDPFLRDIFTPLSVGATILLPRQRDILDPASLAHWWRTARPTVCHLTPQMGMLVASSLGETRGDSLRLAFWGGDKLHTSVVEQLRSIEPGARHVNFYGATETPQAASFYTIDREVDQDGYMPIGTGIADFEIVVLDDDGHPVAAGEHGQLAVESDYMSLGYVADGIIRPFETRGRRYYTGDVGYRDHRGIVSVIGRSDDQIKIRGFRVDLGEISALISKIDGVRNAICLATGDDYTRRIVGFVASSNNSDSVGGHVVSKLREMAPNYMIPSSIIVLKKLPLLPNAKIDREFLIDLAKSRRDLNEGARGDAEVTPTEDRIIKAWQAVLGRTDVSPDATFASLDGDSLSFVMVYLATETCIGQVPAEWVHVPIRQLAANASPTKPTSRPLVARLESAMLVRAGAIVAVVATHEQLILIDIGPTTALLFVSGYIFGKLQLSESIARKSLAPIYRVSFSLFLVTALYTVMASMLAVLRHRPISLSNILMMNDFVDYESMLAHGLADWTTLHIHLWYIHGLIHIMVVMLGLAFIGIRMRLFGRHRFRFALGALILACCARWVWPVLSAWDTGHWQLTDMALQRWLPSTNFATFLLGAMVGASLFKSKKWALMSIFVFALASAPIFGVFQSATFMTVGLLISYFREIPIPRILSRPIYIISGASLFIYLGHIYVYFTLRPQLLKILNFFHSDPQPVTSLSFKLTILAITVAACVSAWAAWNVLQTDAMRMYRKLSRGAPHR